MYLYIFEDGSSNVYKEVAEDDLLHVDNGYLEIFDCTDPFSIKTYFDGSWVLVEPGIV